MGLHSQSYGQIGMFSSKQSRELNYLLNNKKAKIQPVAAQIMEYYQADLSFYERANYTGDEHSHFVFIPYLYIQQNLVE